MPTWPWEKRNLDYTELRLLEAASVAAGNVISASATDAVETAAGYYSAAIASCEVRGSQRSIEALTPEILAAIGRELINPGESVFYIATPNGRIKLIQATIQEVRGDYEEETWQYFLNLATPQGYKSVTLPSRGAVHIRYSTDPRRPWKGLSPVTRSKATAKLLAGIEKMMGNEMSWPSGWLFEIPSGSLGADASENKSTALGALLGKFKAQDGASVMVHSRAEPLEYGDTKTARMGVRRVRVGAEGDQWLTQLRDQVHATFLAACGIPAAMSGGSQSATNSRESYRSWLFSRVLPLTRIISHELSRKLNDTIELDFHSLASADVQGRARAFKSLVDGDMNPEHAAMICGFERERQR